MTPQLNAKVVGQLSTELGARAALRMPERADQHFVVAERVVEVCSEPTEVDSSHARGPLDNA